MSDAYIDFLRESFPKMPLNNERILRKIHLKVCENNIMSDFFLANVLNKYPHAKLEYINMYKIQVNKILIYVGMNDKNILHFCFRSFTESILKFLYSLQNDCELSKINKISFRFLGESLKNEEKALYIGMKNDVNKLLSYYGQYSNDIHGKNVQINNEIEYMKSIISSEDNIDYNKLYKDMSNIIQLYEVILIKALNLKLESGVVFRLCRIISNEDIKRIFN